MPFFPATIGKTNCSDGNYPQPRMSSARTTKVVVATSAMLSFISFWRAAAIVLNDLGSSAYYVGGIAEQAIGHAAPWFILGVMLFSYAVRAVYIESCAMFTRGGVYRVVKEAMGGTLAKLSVSALMFDYILTGPISGVSAGQYIVNLFAQTATYFGPPVVSVKRDRKPPCSWNRSYRHIVLLVAQYARHTRIVQRCSKDHVRYDRHGRYADRLVQLHYPDATR
jgi:amino acid transporter